MLISEDGKRSAVHMWNSSRQTCFSFAFWTFFSCYWLFLFIGKSMTLRCCSCCWILEPCKRSILGDWDIRQITVFQKTFICSQLLGNQ